MEIEKKGNYTRIKRAIYKYLNGTKPETIREIETYLISKYKNAPDFHVLANLMSKSGCFKRVGHESRGVAINGYYKAILWTVK